ncbi:10827_t:CDS:2, partial [Dentiscutata heterogama]
LQNIVKSQPNSYMRHIVQCYGVSQFPKTKDYIFVMSYMSNGSLNYYLSNNFKDMTWKMKLDFLRNIVTGIKWIHENKIIHRDIHDGNILIDKCYIKEAEKKRQELLNIRRPIAKNMHPHSKTPSKLLNPTIDSMLLNLFQGSRSSTLSSRDSFQNITSDLFNIM